MAFIIVYGNKDSICKEEDACKRLCSIQNPLDGFVYEAGGDISAGNLHHWQWLTVAEQNCVTPTTVLAARLHSGCNRRTLGLHGWGDF